VTAAQLQEFEQQLVEHVNHVLSAFGARMMISEQALSQLIADVYGDEDTEPLEPTEEEEAEFLEQTLGDADVAPDDPSHEVVLDDADDETWDEWAAQEAARLRAERIKADRAADERLQALAEADWENEGGLPR